MFARLANYLQRRQPSGYRPGLTLARVRQDLGALDCEALTPTRLRCQHPKGGSFEVSERADAMFLSHTVLCEFVLKVPGSRWGADGARLEIRHTGAFKRQGIECVLKRGDAQALAPLIERIQHDAALKAALLPLDFKRCVLTRNEAGWQVEIEHFGASEVVNRLPSMRRYIRLTPEQRNTLLHSLAALQALLL